MSFQMNVLARAGSLLLLGDLFSSFSLLGQTPVVVQTNATVRVMAANLTSGTGQSYEAAGIHIFQGLKPDIVAMQEFRYNSSTSDAQLRQLVDTAFGPNFFYYREAGQLQHSQRHCQPLANPQQRYLGGCGHGRKRPRICLGQD